MRSNHDFRALLQRQFNGRQMHGYVRRWLLSVFNWYVQIRTDKNAFTSQIQIGHLNYRHGESLVDS